MAKKAKEAQVAMAAPTAPAEVMRGYMSAKSSTAVAPETISRGPIFRMAMSVCAMKAPKAKSR